MSGGAPRRAARGGFDHWRPLLGLLAAAVLFGGAARPAAADAGVLRHGAAVSAANALIAEVRVVLTRAARVFVEYDNPQAGRYRTALSEPGAEHLIPIVRLRPQTTYDYTIFVISDGEDAAAGPGGSFTTGRLPPPLAGMPVRARGRSSQPLILSDYHRGDQHTYVIFQDETGGVVWYYHEPPPFRPSFAFPLPGGNLLIRSRRRLVELTPLGEVVPIRLQSGSEWGRPHHEVTLLGDGRMIYPSWNRIVFDDSANGGSEEATFVSDRLRVWDPASGRIEQVWDAAEAWDVRDPNQRVPHPARNDGMINWTHLNSVSVGPRGNLILSFRERNQVISLSSDFRTIEWQLHGPESDFSFPNPADRFYGQHSAAQLANGNVVLFDNGRRRPEAEGGHYSRALELRLDPAAGTAVKVWEYRSTPDVYSAASGSAFRLRNGNTLVNFGRVELGLDDAPLTVVEVDAAGGEVFRFESLPWSETRQYPPFRYRAIGGVAAIRGETMLRPPAAAPRPEGAETVAGGFTVAGDPVRFRELSAAVEGAPRIAAGGPFDLYLVDGRLVYRKEPCAPEDVAERFALHLFPAGAGAGFDNHDFWFMHHGLRRHGACIAAITLPDYRVARIRTGQFHHSPPFDGTEPFPQGDLWSADFPGDVVRYQQARAAIAAGERGAPAARATPDAGGFALYLDAAGTELIYFKEPCAVKDLQERFFLHLFPADARELAAGERQAGFHNRSFAWAEHGALLHAETGAACVALVPLPAYEGGIARVRAGQFNGWSVEFPAGE